MSLLATIILEADPGRGAQDPGAGLSALLIVAVVVAIVAVMAALFFAFHKLSRKSRGGVQPRAGEFRRGGPPLESLGRRRD
jgi:flagellar basal body-associated protein FliL